MITGNSCVKVAVVLLAKPCVYCGSAEASESIVGGGEVVKPESVDWGISVRRGVVFGVLTT